MNRLRILYKNLHIILSKEISKLKEYMEELKSYYVKQNTKLNELIEKTTNILQGYQLIECELATMKKKLISIGEKITSEILKNIYNKKNMNKEIYFIMDILYEILKNNIDTMEKNNSSKEKKIEKKYILLLLSFISETSNLNITKEILENAKLLINKYDEYKIIYTKSFPEILTIIDFIEALLIYYTKLKMIKKLYNSNQNKNNKMTTIQSDMDKQAELMIKTKSLLEKIIIDYENYKKIIESKDKNNRMIYGYNILEKYGLYEKYIVSEKSYNDYDSEYYNNYGGNEYNSSKKKKFVISLDKKFRTKEKFIPQLFSCLIMYNKGIRKINLEKFIKVVKENKNTSVNKNSSNAKSLSNKKNKNNISINFSTNNILMKSYESNNSSVNLKRSFQTYQTNSIFKKNKLNNSPFRNEYSRNNNNNSIFGKKSFVDSYPTFDNFCKNSKNSNSNSMQQKDGLNISSIDYDQTKNTTKTINSVKSSMIKGKNKNTICFRNVKQNQVNLKFENEQWSFCSYCCKNMENKINEICEK